jgi:hypothetical protein
LRSSPSACPAAVSSRSDKSELAKKLAQVLTTAQIQQLLGHLSATGELAGIEKYVPP